MTTGVGAVFNTAKVAAGLVGRGVRLRRRRPERSIQGARIAGAERIIAIDTLRGEARDGEAVRRHRYAVRPSEDAVKALEEADRRRPDYAFECVGSGELAGDGLPRHPPRRPRGGGRRGEARRLDLAAHR